MYQAQTSIALNQRGIRSTDRAEAHGTCQLLTQNGSWVLVQVRNMSPTGVLISSPYTLRPGSADLVTGASEAIAMRIVWSNGDRHGCRFEKPMSTRGYLNARASLQVAAEWLVGQNTSHARPATRPRLLKRMLAGVRLGSGDDAAQASSSLGC